jgi:ketopantoate hydroxymethyltransferase
MVREGGVDAVKLEGGAEYAEVIKAISQNVR